MADSKDDHVTIVHVSPEKLCETSRRHLSVDTFRELEDEIYAESMEVLSASLAFGDITPDQETCPAEWVEKLGRRAAEKKFRLAKAAWLNAKEAPVGLRMAQATAIGIARVRQGDKMIAQLNIGYVNLIQPAPTFREKEVDNEGGHR